MKTVIQVVIFGAGRGGHDLFQLVEQIDRAHDKLEYRVLGFVDPKGGKVLGLPVWETLAEIPDHGGEILHGVCGIQDPEIRRKVYKEEFSSRAIAPLTLVHPSVDIPRDLQLSDGCVVYPGVIIGLKVRLGFGVLVNYQSFLGVRTQIGDFSFIGPNVCLTADCAVGEDTIIGASSSFIPGTKVGSRCMIGIGSRVFSHVPNDHRSVDLPRRYLRPISEIRKGKVSWDNE